MKKPFEVGERFAVYTGLFRRILKLSAIREDGLLCFDDKDNPGHYSYTIHHKQCRRLIKKPEEEDERRFVNMYGNSSGAHAFATRDDADAYARDTVSYSAFRTEVLEFKLVKRHKVSK